MPDPFIDVDDLSAYLGRDLTNDDGAVMAVDAACDTIRDITEQYFNAGTSTISLDGTGTDALILPQGPLTNVGTVSVNGVEITDYVPTTNDSNIGILYRGAAEGWPRPVWPRGRQNVRVTYEHGYPDGDVPRSIRMVALSIASRLVVQGVAQSETVGDVTINYGMAASDLTKNEERILYGYLHKRSF